LSFQRLPRSSRFTIAKQNKATQAKRNRERSQQERKQEKDERRAQRKELRLERDTLLAEGIDPGLVGIVAGPQPIPEDF
jgi:hypothetical protein